MIKLDPRELLSRWLDHRPAIGKSLPNRSTPFAVVETRSRRGVIRLRVIGDIDLTAKERLRAVLVAAAAGNAGEVRIDLVGSTFLDCSGIGALVAGRIAAADAGCHFRIIRARGIVLRVLDTADMLEFLSCDHRAARWAAEVSPPRAVFGTTDHTTLAAADD